MGTVALESVGRTSKGAAGLRAAGLTVLFVIVVQIALFVAGRLFGHEASAGLKAAGEITAIALGEIAMVGVTYGMLRTRQNSLRDIGLWQKATIKAWVFGIGLGLLIALWGLSNPALHLHSKLGALFDPSLWHVYAAVTAGLAAGFCEEIIFRGYVMHELMEAGCTRTMQVIGSAVLFGVAHAGLLRGGILTGLLVIVPTAILGALYAMIYLAGKRSLMPVIVSHFLNDVAVIPWVFFVMASMRH